MPKLKTLPEWQTQFDLFQKIMNDTIPVTTGKVEGGGVSSGVVRLNVMERRAAPKPGAAAGDGRIAGQAEDKWAVYDFYLRGSTLGYDGNDAITDFYRRVASAVCTSEKYRQTAGSGGPGAPTPRLHVPRMYACVDQSMTGIFDRAKSIVEAKIGNFWGATAKSNAWTSMVIVEGVRCRSLKKFAEDGTPIPPTFNYKGHACALAVVNVIDALVGNADRVQAPNIGNFFVDDAGGVIAIDCDTALPPKKGQDAEWQRVVFNAVRRDGALGAKTIWPFIPNELALFKPYTVSPSEALGGDFDNMLGRLKGLKDPTVVAYCKGMDPHRYPFQRAGLDTLRAVKDMASDLPNWFSDDDPRCSRATLLAKIKSIPSVT